MGATVGSLAFMPPTRSSEELKRLEGSPQFLRVSGSLEESDPDQVTPAIAALHYDRSAPLTLLYSHGNAEDLLDVQDTLESLSETLKVNVFSYDYPGYGLTPGVCNETACCNAVSACFEYLLDKGINRDSIVLVGRSLGSGPTVDLASREPGIAGVVLQSPFLSIIRTALSEPLARAMQNADLFDNARKMSSVSCPVFVIHGQEDRIVPPEHGAEIFAMAPKQSRHWWLPGCGHNDVHQHADYHRKLKEFIDFLNLRSFFRRQDLAKAFAGSMMVVTMPKPKLLITAM